MPEVVAKVIWVLLVMLAFFSLCLDKLLQKYPVFIIALGILNLEESYIILFRN